MASSFPKTSVTLIAKIKSLASGDDSAAWVRFWDVYQGAIRRFAANKGGEENADDIVMTVLAKLVDVLRSGQYVPEKGHFHSYLATMIVNEIHMAHRKHIARAGDRRLSLDAEAPSSNGVDGEVLSETLAAPEVSPDVLDEDWRRAVLESATTRVLTQTALSERDRAVYKAFVQEGRDIGEVAASFGISRNLVSQVKTRITKRIIALGQEMVAAEAR